MPDTQQEIDKILQPLTNANAQDIEILKEDLRIVKFKLQELLDMLEGRIRSANLIEYRDVYVFNDVGNLDADHPLIMDFELIEGMTKLIECKVSFRIRNFRSPVTL